MSEEGDSSASSTTIKSFSVQVKPYSKKRPMFNPAIFGTPKRQKPEGSSKSGSPYLWSQTPPKDAPSSSSVEFKENESKSRDDGYYSKDGTFHKWSLSNGAHSLQRRIRMGLYNHSAERSPRQVKTRIEKDESDFIMPSSAKEIFATLDRLTRPINRDPSHGWMSMRDAEKKPIPKPGEPGGPPVGWRTPSKWNRERVGITNMDQLRLHKSQMEARAKEMTSLNNHKSTSVPAVQHPTSSKANSGGGGKIQNKMTRMHESRHVPDDDIEPISYSLDTVPKLNSTASIDLTGPQSCSTPQVKSTRLKQADLAQLEKTADPTVDSSSILPSFSLGRVASLPPANVRYIKVNKTEGVQLFSQPKRRATESSSQESSQGAESSQDSQVSSFSFSQPKKVTKLSLTDRKRNSNGSTSAKQWTPKKQKGDVIVKVKYPGFKSEKLKQKTTEKPEENDKIEKTDDQKLPAVTKVQNFDAFIAKQKTDSQGKWDCDICMVKNDAAAQKCISCESPNPSSKPKPPPADPAPLPTTSGGFGDFMAKQKLGSQGKWTCDICCVQNDKALPKCSACETPNPNAPKQASPPVSAPPVAASTPLPVASGGFSDFLNKQKKDSQGKWNCDVCMISNEPGIAKCASCETPNPNASATSTPANSQAAKFSFGTPSSDSSAPAAEKPKFSFGASTSSTFAFGKASDKSATPPAASFGFGNPSKSDETTKPAAETAAPKFSFGKTAKTDTPPAAPVEEPKSSMFGGSGFSGFGGQKTDSAPKFGTSELPAKADEASAPKFSFSGSQDSAPKSNFPAEKPSFSFGGESAPKTDSSFSFGGGAKVDTPKAETKKPFSFAPSTAADPPAVAEKPSFSFAPSSKAAEVATKPFSFGASTTTNEAPKPETEKPKFSFSGAKNADPPKSDSPFSFGAKTESSNPPPSMFAPPTGASSPASFAFAPSSQPATSSNSSSLFSGAAESSGFSFGKTAPAQSAPAPTSGFSFGASSTTNTADKQPTKAFNFQSSSMFSPTNEKPSFGAPAPQQQQPAAAAFSFGGESKSTTQKPFVFGGSNQANSGSSLFGATSNTPAGQAPAQQAASIFGAATTTTTPQAPSMFGSTSAPSKSGFNFGAGAPSSTPSGGMFGTQPEAASFSFGAASGNASSSSSQPKNFAPSFGQSNDQGNNMFAIQNQSQTGTPTATRRKAVAKRRNQKKY